MNAWGHLLFNAFANGLLSFVCALAIVYVVLCAVRIESAGCRLWLLLLPFAKLVIDLIAGVPESSFLWAKLAGHTQDYGQFQVGLGLWYFGPRLVFMLGAFSDGLIYPQSFGDLVDGALAKRLGASMPVYIAAVVLAIGLTRVGLRAWQARAFLRRTFRRARVVERRRAVRVLISESYLGVPFAIGVWRPRVVFSARVYDGLAETEREAALQHELAHVAHGDLALLATLHLLADVFWFLPGARGLCARIHHALEQRADDRALASGVQPGALASALVRAGEIVHQPAAGVAMFSGRSSLEQRVRRLLDVIPTETRGAATARLALSLLVTLTIVQAIFAGNYHAPLVRFAIP